MENPQKIDEQLRQRSERPDGENLWTADQEWGSGLAPYIKLISFKKKMKPTNPNAHAYVNGTDVKTHGYAVTHNTFLQ